VLIFDVLAPKKNGYPDGRIGSISLWKDWLVASEGYAILPKSEEKVRLK
jgi:hypothetical protein